MPVEPIPPSRAPTGALPSPPSEVFVSSFAALFNLPNTRFDNNSEIRDKDSNE